MGAAEMYRGAAKKIPAIRDFYRALAITYERSAREMLLMLDKVERLEMEGEMAA